MKTKLRDGILLEHSELGKTIGFTKDKISGFLWKRDDYIWIGFVRDKEDTQENLSRLLDLILTNGYGIACPSPSGKMHFILEKKGFTKTEQPYYIERFKNGWSKHYCERKDVWIKEPLRI